MNKSEIKELRSGFTLLELILVMSVIGILAGLFIANYPSSQRRARDARRVSDLRQYQSALEIYYNANNEYPGSSGDLSGVCGSDLSQYTSVCPDNPSGTWNYQYVGDSAGYYIYTQLEQNADDGSTRYQFFCSNGKAGETTSDPGGTDPC